MIKNNKCSLALLVLRLLLGGLFLFAAYNKLRPPDPGNVLDNPIQRFLFSVEAFQIVPVQLTEAAAFTIPWLEVVCGVLLILGIWTRASALVLGLLTGSFVFAINRALTSGNIDVDCGCFGDLALVCPKDQLTTCHLVRSSIFAGMALILFLFGSGRYAVDGLIAGDRSDQGPQKSEVDQRRPKRLVPTPMAPTNEEDPHIEA